MEAIAALHLKLQNSTDELESIQQKYISAEESWKKLTKEIQLEKDESLRLKASISECSSTMTLEANKLRELKVKTQSLELERDLLSSKLESFPLSISQYVDSFIEKSNFAMNSIANFKKTEDSESSEEYLQILRKELSDKKKALVQSELAFQQHKDQELKELSDQMKEEESSISFIQICIESIRKKIDEIHSSSNISVDITDDYLTSPDFSEDSSQLQPPAFPKLTSQSFSPSQSQVPSSPPLIPVRSPPSSNANSRSRLSYSPPPVPPPPTTSTSTTTTTTTQPMNLNTSNYPNQHTTTVYIDEDEATDGFVNTYIHTRTESVIDSFPSQNTKPWFHLFRRKSSDKGIPSPFPKPKFKSGLDLLNESTTTMSSSSFPSSSSLSDEISFQPNYPSFTEYD